VKIRVNAFTIIFILIVIALGSHNSVAEVNNGIDVVLVMDSSGSMKKTDPLSLRIPAAKLFISLLENNDRAGIVSFSDKGYPIVPLTPLNSTEHRDLLLGAAEKISSTGLYTNLHDALSSGLSVLSQDMASERTRFIILMSDGMMDVGDKDKDLSLVDDIKNDLTLTLENEKVKVYTIAFTEQADKQLLEKMSKRTGGFYNLALTDKDFHLIFSSIFESLKKPEMLPMDENGFLIDGSIDEVTIVATKSSPETLIHLNAPDGQSYSHRGGATGIEWFVSENFDMITVQKPAEGRWDVLFSTGENNRAYIITDLKLQTNFDQLYSTFGDPLDIKIWLEKDGTVITEQNVLDKFDIHLELTGPDGEATKLTPFHKGDGIFIRTVAPFTPGNYKLRIIARGNTFEREKGVVFNIADARESKEDIQLLREKEKRAKAEAVNKPEESDDAEKISWAKAISQFIFINLLVGIILLLFFKRKSLKDIKELKKFFPFVSSQGGKLVFNVKTLILRTNVEEPRNQPENHEENQDQQKHAVPEEPEPQTLDIPVEHVKNQRDQETQEELIAQEESKKHKPEELLETADTDTSDKIETEDAEEEPGAEGAQLNAETKLEEESPVEDSPSSGAAIQAENNQDILSQDNLDQLLKENTQDNTVDMNAGQAESTAEVQDSEDKLSQETPEHKQGNEAGSKVSPQDSIDDMCQEALQTQKKAESETAEEGKTADAIEPENDINAQSQENADQNAAHEDNGQNSPQDNIDDMWQEALQAQKEGETAEPEKTVDAIKSGDDVQELQPQEKTEHQEEKEADAQSTQQDNIDGMWHEALQAQKEADKEKIVSDTQDEGEMEAGLPAEESEEIHKEGTSSD
jgi:hypothetical protein